MSFRRLCCCLGSSKTKEEGMYHPLLPDEERQAINDLLQFFRTSVDIGQPSEEHMRALLYVSYSERVDLQRTASLCFAEISDRMRGEASMDMVEAIVSLLQISDTEVQQASSLALSNLALRGPSVNKKTIMQAGGLRPLIALLSSSNVDVQCNACGCITTLATSEVNKRAIVEHGALKPLFRLAKSLDSRVQRNAAGAMLNITHIENNRDDMVRGGAVPVLIDLLNSQDRDVQYYSAAALSNIAVNQSHRTVIMGVKENEVLRLLLRLLTSTSNKVKSQACLALRNLASDDITQARIVELGGLARLLPVLRVSDENTSTAAVAAARNISIHDGNAPHFVREQYLPELCILLGKERWQEAQTHAAGTLRNLAAEKQIIPLLDSGCTQIMMELLDNPRATDAVLAEVTAAIAIFCSSEDALADMMAKRGKALCRSLAVKATDSLDMEVRYNCVGAIGHLAMQKSTHKTLLSCEPSILQLLHTLMLPPQDEAFTHLALWVLEHLAEGDAETKQQLRISAVFKDLKTIASSNLRAEILELAKSVSKALAVSP